MSDRGITVLVTGGAGYIGSHACKSLRSAGHVPVTYDNLSTGWQDAVKFGPFEPGDLQDRARLDDVIARHQPRAVMHFAAVSDVGEATRDPGKYWRNNVLGSLTLLEAMAAAGIEMIVFSSTCAVYGEPDGVALDEDCPTRPINSYGASKLAIEQMLAHFGESTGLRSVIFRYFNVAGADPESEIGEFHRPETHLVPRLLDAVLQPGTEFTIYGTDYDTPDGTCIRDYIHVSDLVDAHILGLDRLLAGGSGLTFNLGTGTGFSVREVVDQARTVTNRDIEVIEGPRRPGDAVRLVSGSGRARTDLGWKPTRSNLDEMITDAWRWHRSECYRR